MTVQQLRYLLEVNRSGSITQAAKNLYVAQSSVSNAIAALEEELGFQIFTRSYQGVIPTERGEIVLGHASHICEHHRLMLDGTKPMTQTVRIAATHYLPFYDAFAQLVKEFQGQKDLAFAHYCFTHIEHTAEMLSLFDLDISAHMPLSSTMRSVEIVLKKKKLEYMLIKRLPAVIRIGRGHPLYDVPDLQPEDFNDQIFVDTTSALVVRSDAMFRVAKLNINTERTLLSDSQKMRYALVAQGLGYFIGPVLPERIKNQYGFRCIPLPNLSYDIIAVTNPLRPIHPAVQRYLELLREDLDAL